MIRFLEGKLIDKREKSVVLLVNGVGYEVELPATVRRAISSYDENSPISLHISYQQSTNQLVPRLYGFLRQLERDFFEELLRVDKLGPSIALSAMSVPVNQIARAIAERDTKTLKSIKGVAEKMADKIVAELKNGVAKYALLPEEATSVAQESADFRVEVRETLTKQLHFKAQEAQRLIDLALKQNSTIASAEDLFDEVLKIHK